MIIQKPFAFVFPSTPAISTLSPVARLWVAVVICIGAAVVAAVIARVGAEIPQFHTAPPSYFFLTVDRAKKIRPIWLPKFMSRVLAPSRLVAISAAAPVSLADQTLLSTPNIRYRVPDNSVVKREWTLSPRSPLGVAVDPVRRARIPSSSKTRLSIRRTALSGQLIVSESGCHPPEKLLRIGIYCPSC